MANSASDKKLSENDLEFHRILGQASKNLLAERVYNFIIDFMEPSIAATHKGRSGEIVYEIHRDIVDLIESKDAGRIDEAITKSCRYLVHTPAFPESMGRIRISAICLTYYVFFDRITIINNDRGGIHYE